MKARNFSVVRSQNSGVSLFTSAGLPYYDA